jgi:hypothetical protein
VGEAGRGVRGAVWRGCYAFLEEGPGEAAEVNGRSIGRVMEGSSYNDA